MIELACGDDPVLEASDLESGVEKSYSITTIERVRAAHPADNLYFLIGADAFAEITTWHRWTEVIRLVEFIVVSRPGHRYEIPGGATVHALETLDLPVSSSELRRRLAVGETPAEIPPAVLAYIRRHRLYSDR